MIYPDVDFPGGIPCSAPWCFTSCLGRRVKLVFQEYTTITNQQAVRTKNHLSPSRAARIEHQWAPVFEKLLSHTFGAVSLIPNFRWNFTSLWPLNDENLHHSQVVIPVTPHHEIPMDPHSMREPRAASHARTICGSTCRQILVVSEPWKSTAPWTVRISDFFSMTWDMGGWNQQHQPKSAIEKSLSFFCSEYVYIYNEFSFCMFHIECVTCIVQLFFCNRMILKSHEPPGFLCPFYGFMVRWCKKKPGLSRDPRDHGRVFSWPDEAQLNIMGLVCWGKS